jgi:hypothetical protein
MGHLLHARLLEALLQHGQTFVEGHAGFEQMPELLGKDQQLTVRDFQLRRRHGRDGRRHLGCRARAVLPLLRHDRRAADRLDPNRDIMQLLDLPDRDRAIGTIEDALNETALGVARAIGKLRHGKVPPELIPRFWGRLASLSG